MRAFSLIELMVAMAILAIVTAVALPIYNTYQARAQRTNAQADLVRCAQGMERHANVVMSYALAVDTDGDGMGDASSGAVSANICLVNAGAYDIALQSADAGSFVLRASATRGTGEGMLETDSAGGRRWDRNDDGDFDDARERDWRP